MALGDIEKLIGAGKEEGYLTYDEVNDLIPRDVDSSEDLNEDVPTTFDPQGIRVLEGHPKLPSSAFETEFEKEEEAGEDVSPKLPPGALAKTQDPVRIYLREMAAAPLLTREGEVDIAKRIERGQLRVLKALSIDGSENVLLQLLAMDRGGFVGTPLPMTAQRVNDGGIHVKIVFVGNLDFETTPQDLRQLFEAYGQVEHVNIIKNRETGLPREFAFVEMPNDAEADRAIQALNGRILKERTLNVEYARPRAVRRTGLGGHNKRRRTSCS